MKLDDIKSRVETVRSLRDTDPEAWHAAKDALYTAILEDIACNTVSAVVGAMAREALVLEDEDEQPKWTACA